MRRTLRTKRQPDHGVCEQEPIVAPSDKDHAVTSKDAAMFAQRVGGVQKNAKKPRAANVGKMEKRKTYSGEAKKELHALAEFDVFEEVPDTTCNCAGAIHSF